MRMMCFFPSMPLSLSGITHHSHLFTRLKIYHHIYFIYHAFPTIQNPSSNARDISLAHDMPVDIDCREMLCLYK